MTTYRLDIKNFGQKENALQIIANNCITETPKWLADDHGRGQMIQGHSDYNVFKLKVIKDGTLKIDFRGSDKRFNNERIPVWIDYKSVKIDGKEILVQTTSAWYGKPITIEFPVKDGQEITLEVEQQYHQYTKDELKDIISKLYPQCTCINEFLDYYKNKVSFKKIEWTWDYVKNYVLTQEPQRIKVDDITHETCGCLRIGIGTTCFETVLIPSKTKKLYVFLSSGGKDVPYPIFHRIPTFENYDGMRLFFDDPTRIEVNDNGISWYLGGGGEIYRLYNSNPQKDFKNTPY